MSVDVHRGPARLFAHARPLSLPAFVKRAAKYVYACYRRQRARQELLAYLDSDYRAAGDIGISRSEARGWTARPFWRS
jgi:uncharacterized protein YjiS (DUF1127 family)